MNTIRVFAVENETIFFVFFFGCVTAFSGLSRENKSWIDIGQEGRESKTSFSTFCKS